jgi:signal recognition particle GTPase
MLEKIGEMLKQELVTKLQMLFFLDKGLVDEIVRELQRTLIEAYVKL